MSNPTTTHPRTSISVVSWVDGDTTYARLYTQDPNGGIHETLYDGKSWSAGNVIATAKVDSPIAACRSFVGIIQVFYLTNDNIVNGVYLRWPKEHKWDNDPIDGYKFQAAPESRLAVVPNLDDNPSPGKITYTVYYQKPNGSIGRKFSDGGQYTDGGSFGDQALLGTGLAAVNFKDQNETATTRIFYQLSDGALTDVSVVEDSTSFSPGDQELVAKTKGQVPPHTNLSAISTRSGEYPAFQLYSAYLKDNSTVVAEWGYYSGTWKHANPAPIPLAADGGIAMFYDLKSLPKPLFKVYAQHGTDQILEYTAENQWGPWKIASIIPEII